LGKGYESLERNGGIMMNSKESFMKHAEELGLKVGQIKKADSGSITVFLNNRPFWMESWKTGSYFLDGMLMERKAREQNGKGFMEA
jgi:uncharacterized protein YbaP (TraB family)